MNNNDVFGCTTFRKGNYLGRSYDFYCNNVASSVLHTGRIEGVRYESIGMSGSSFNGMIKEKALDGSIDKVTMDKLFSSIVDGINENGVAISTLVVPRGDKGITTGTNPSKPSITARLVSRVVMDKAYSAKHAIKLLSELNIKQTWGTEYELHWMIADADDTYIVETVNNKLSYLGPSAIEGIEDLYNGTLEADIITNFYQTGFKSSFANTYVTTQNWGKETRVYEVPQPYDADGGYYEYADGGDVEVRSGEYVKAWGTDHGVIDDVLEDDKYYIVTTKHEDGTWTFSGVTLEVRGNEPLYHADGTLVDMPLLSEYIEGTGEGFNTFEMPITNPTVTPYGAGLERYKIVKDKLAQVNGTLADDKEAMGIINLVQYTNAYKDDTVWYSEFVSHSQGIDNRTDVSEGSAYVNGINELKATYQSIFSEGGKEAVRALGAQLGEGASWHSNHQCVYDLANKTMLVYPSENGEHAFRVDVHGVVEDEAVEIGGEASVEILPLGGKIFYIDSSDNGATYHFYDESGSEIEGWTDIASLDDAVSYSVEGEPTADKFYVFDNNLATSKRWTYHDGSAYKYEQIFTTPSATYEIGQGRINTQTVMAKDDGKYITDNSSGYATIWYVCNEVNKSERGGCSDWFIPSQKELDALRTSSVVPSNWFSSNYIWTSSESSRNTARDWGYGSSDFGNDGKNSSSCCVCVRAF